MQQGTQTTEFDIAEARRVLGDVFAPWVQDLGLSIGSIECAPPPGAVADWQPGAILRMAFSERLCRNGGIVCGQALMALADTSMVIAILAANRGYGRCACGSPRTHHELRPRHPVERLRQQAGGDGLKRLCDAVKLHARRYLDNLRLF
jgi:hypothetical protein